MSMRRPWYRRAVMFLVFIAASAFVALLFSTSGPFRSVEGRGVSASEANARLWNCLVPDSAVDVWYTSAFRGTRVECTLTQTDFLVWRRQRGWKPEPIKPGGLTPWSTLRDGVRRINQGLQFNHGDGDLGFVGCHDAENGRAYVSYSGG